MLRLGATEIVRVGLAGEAEVGEVERRVDVHAGVVAEHPVDRLGRGVAAPEQVERRAAGEGVGALGEGRDAADHVAVGVAHRVDRGEDAVDPQRVLVPHAAAVAVLVVAVDVPPVEHAAAVVDLAFEADRADVLRGAVFEPHVADILDAAHAAQRERLDVVVDHRLAQVVGQERVVLEDSDRGRRAEQRAARVVVLELVVVAAHVLREDLEIVAEFVVAVSEDRVAVGVRVEREQLAVEVVAVAADRAARGRSGAADHALRRRPRDERGVAAVAVEGEPVDRARGEHVGIGIGVREDDPVERGAHRVGVGEILPHAADVDRAGAIVPVAAGDVVDAVLLGARAGEQEVAAVADLRAEGDPRLVVLGVAAIADAPLQLGLEPGEIGVEPEVDHPGHRVGAVLRRGAAGHGLEPADHRVGEQVDVDPAERRARGHPAPVE